MHSGKFSSNILFFCLFTQSLFAGYANFSSQFALHPEKQSAWQEMAEKIDRTTDGIGYPIDEKIKEPVIVLNLLGFQTGASCEGHLDHGNSYPWIRIDFEQPVPPQWRQDAEEAFRIAEKTPNDANNIREVWHRYHEIRESIEQFQLRQMFPFHCLLEQFYSASNSSYSVSVQIGEDISSGMIWFYSLDGKWQTIRDEDEKKAKLLAYQEEMDRFTDFLIDKFLNE